MQTSKNILVLSDTHLASGSALPARVLELAARADLIIHAGDLTDIDVLDVLGSFAPTHAVLGNCDSMACIEKIPQELEVLVGETKIAALHIPGPEEGRHSRLEKLFPDADIVIYGHTHQPEITRLLSGKLILNPGSATQKRAAAFHSVIWLELSQNEDPQATLINLDQP